MQGFDENIRGEVRPLLAMRYRLDDVRGEKGKIDQASNTLLRDTLASCDV